MFKHVVAVLRKVSGVLLRQSVSQEVHPALHQAVAKPPQCNRCRGAHGEETLFPGIMWYTPAPQWWVCPPEKLTGSAISDLYCKAIPEFVPAQHRMWALHHAPLFKLLDQYGGWQAYFLAAYDVDFPTADAVVMDVVLSNMHQNMAMAYWKALLSGVPAVDLDPIEDAADLAEKHPILWQKHVEGLKWVDLFFSRHYKPLNAASVVA